MLRSRIASFALQFGPPEFFLIALLGLVLVATTTRGKMLRALVAGDVRPREPDELHFWAWIGPLCGAGPFRSK